MESSKSYVYPLVVIGILFGALGFITWVNGVLIPYFQLGLELTHVQSFLVTFASYGAYFIMSIPSAFVLRKTGYKKGISLGLIVMAIGSILFLPAANYRIYGMFLTGLFVTGTGMALLQTAVNPYIVIMGPQESAAQRIGFMGVSNKVAGILSQSVLGTFFLVGASEITKRLALASPEEKEMILGEYVRRVEGPYLIITIVLLLLSVFIFFSGLPEVKEKGEDTDVNLNTPLEKVKVAGIFKFPYLVLGIIALFVSGACEVIPIDGVISYAGSLGIPLDDARYFGAYSLYCMVFGYILSIVLIPKYLSQERALLYVSITGIILSLLSYFSIFRNDGSNIYYSNGICECLVVGYYLGTGYPTTRQIYQIRFCSSNDVGSGRRDISIDFWKPSRCVPSVSSICDFDVGTLLFVLKFLCRQGK